MTENIALVDLVGSALPATPPAPQSDLDKMLAFLERAVVDQRVDVDKLQALWAMRKEVEDAADRRAFNRAVAAAKAEIGPIFKAQEVDFTYQGKRTNYRYESFSDLAKAVDGPLGRHGLSYRFRSSQTGKMLKLTCVLAHEGGYCEDVSLEAANDEGAGKNSIQAVGSASTYLQRYTLKLALGIAASADDDARGANVTDSGDLLGELRSLIVEGVDDPADIPAYTQKVVDWLGAPSIEQMTPDQLRRAIAGVRQSIARKGRAA